MLRKLPLVAVAPASLGRAGSYLRLCGWHGGWHHGFVDPALFFRQHRRSLQVVRSANVDSLCPSRGLRRRRGT